MERPPFPEDRLLTVQELSAETGVSVASIKFYLRESLLRAGDRTRPGRAYYDGRHVRRLLLIRALRDVAGMSIEAIRRAVASVDAARTDAVDVIAPAIDALAVPRDTPPVDADLRRARCDVDALFERAELQVRPAAGSRETMARTIASLRRMGAPIGQDELTRYLALVRPLAEMEIAVERTKTILLEDKEQALEIAVLGTVLFEPLLVGLRRALHEHYTTVLVRKQTKKSRRRSR